MMIPDLSGTPEVDGGGFEPPPAGDYTLRVARIDENPTKEGKPMLTVEFRVHGGEHAGKFVRDRFTFTKTDGQQNEFSKGLLRKLLASVGLPAGGCDSAMLRDRIVAATVTVESYGDPPKYSGRPSNYRKAASVQQPAAQAQPQQAAPVAIDPASVPF